jgi:hypothetical protein
LALPSVLFLITHSWKRGFTELKHLCSIFLNECKKGGIILHILSWKSTATPTSFLHFLLLKRYPCFLPPHFYPVLAIQLFSTEFLEPPRNSSVCDNSHANTHSKKEHWVTVNWGSLSEDFLGTNMYIAHVLPLCLLRRCNQTDFSGERGGSINWMPSIMFWRLDNIKKGIFRTYIT